MILRLKVEKSLHHFIRSAAKFGLLFLTVLIVADSIGIPVTSLVTVLGVVGLSVSLAVQDSLAATIPFPSRLGQPAEFADTVAFILRTRYLNGETIRLDGATRLAPK